MKIKTSVTLSEELLEAISAETHSENRSAFIETATWEFLERRKQQARDRREIERINANSAFLNDEAGQMVELQDDE